MFKNLKWFNFLIVPLDLFLLVILVYDFGFEEYLLYEGFNLIGLPIIVFLLLTFNIFKYWRNQYDPKIKAITRLIIIVLLLLIAVETYFMVDHFEGSLAQTFSRYRRVLEYGMLFYFFIRLTVAMQYIYRAYFNPAVLFIGSFGIVAFIGTFLLLLPNATTQGINFTDALFTAISAVSVNGLMVVPIGESFTLFGKTILMILFQIGGLGMLTFATFFSYFLRAGPRLRRACL